MASKINKILTNQSQEFSNEELANVSASLSAILGQGGGGAPCASAWLPYVNSEGDLSWYLTMSTVAPATVNIMGPEGPSGSKGDKGDKGDQGIQGPQGETGAQGPQGDPGVTPVFQINASTNFWEVSYDNGSTWTSLGTSATGPAGADGFSPTITLSAVTDASHNNGGTEVNITYKNGDATATATYTAWNGNDGTMTDAPNIVGHNGVSAEFAGTTYNVGLSGDYYSASNPSGFMDKLFTAEYNVTPYSDIESAYNAGKIVYCKVPVTGTAGNNYRMAFLAYANVTGGDFEFQYYRSIGTKKLTQQNDELIVYKCASANGWQTPNTRITSVPISAGNGLSATFASDKLRLDVTATGGLSEVSAVAPLSGDGTSEHPLGIDMSNAYSIDGAHGITAIPNTADNKVIVQMTDDVWAYYQRLAASANVWDSASAIGNKSKTTINNSVNAITTENNGTSATLSAVEYKVNTSFQNAAAKQLFVVQDDNDIYAKLSEVNGKGSLFFVCSAI